MMRAVVISLIFFAAVHGAFSQALPHKNDIVLADLPADILEQFMIILKGEKLTETVNCGDPVASDIDFLLYTRNNKLDAQMLDLAKPEQLTPNKKLILIIHGWIQHGNGYKMQEVKNAFLDRYDANVITVNWGRPAWDLYTKAVCKLPKIAKIIASYLCAAHQQNGLDFEQVHVVGHSLGGQMAGYIGQHVKSICGQTVARITGLDPAGPLYTDAPIERRLDSTDAKFVQVIHSNGGVFGYLNKCGHADFFVNCGTVQPGCLVPDLTVGGLINLPIMAVGCHHFRAMDLMVEAVSTNNFKAIPCQFCPHGCPPVLSIFKTKVTMGEQCPPETRGNFYLLTNHNSPFAANFVY